MFDDLQKHPISEERPEEGKTLTNGDIYIMPLDTNETRLLCHVDGVSLKTFGTTNNKLICGDWVGIIIRPTQNYINSTGESSVQNDMVIVNMKTGEYHISRYIE